MSSSPHKASLSGTQKAILAVALAMVVLRKRSRLVMTEVMEEQESTTQRDNRKTKLSGSADETIIESLHGISKTLPKHFAGKSSEVLTAIVLFDISTFLWRSEPKADNTYVKEVLVNLRAEGQCISKESSLDLKAHIKQRTLQKIFGNNVTVFHSVLCVLWELSSLEEQSSLLFAEAIIDILREICEMTSVPAHFSDAEVLKRVHMLVIFIFRRNSMTIPKCATHCTALP